MAKRFTLEEAESLLPQVRELLREAVGLKAEYEQAEASIQAFTQKVMVAGGLLVDRDRIAERKRRRDRSAEQLKAAIESIQEIGCLVKDLDMGLVDFPTTLRGREVYLCWKLGEPDIRFWHGVTEGFRGRKPIDQDFLENHRGDAAN